MTDLPYTDADLRAEAARQHFALLQDPDFMGIGEQMDGSRIESTVTDPEAAATTVAGGRTWDMLSRDDFDTAQRAIDDLLTSAADVSEWAINLGAAGLTNTTDMGWYVTGSGWDLAVQIAHDPQIKPEVLDEIESAVRLAVERVLGEHGLKPRLDT